MGTLKVISALLSLALTTALAASEFRTFTDSQGREMVAKLTQASGEDIYIERQDGLTTKVPISIFSEDDQIYIKEWARMALLKEGAFDIRFATDRSDKTKFNDSRSKGLLEKTWKESYEVILKNTSYEDFSDIRIEYLVLKFEDALAAQKRSEGQIVRFQGERQINNLPAREEASIQTEQIPMRETKLAPNYYWKEGGKEESEDDIRGIWAKIYVDGEFIMDFARPENLPRTTEW